MLNKRFPNHSLMPAQNIDRWLWIQRVKHVVGIHTYVEVERWDRERDTIQFVGLRCWFCDRAAA